jgi:hypothetical protein
MAPIQLTHCCPSAESASSLHLSSAAELHSNCYIVNWLAGGPITPIHLPLHLHRIDLNHHKRFAIQPLTQPPAIIMPRPPPSLPPSVLANDYIPPKDNYPPVPDKADNAIRLMLSAFWQISNPRAPAIIMPRPPPSLPPSVLAKDYIPPKDNYPPVPDKADNAIRLMLSAVWQISNPREYQIKAIFYLVFLRLRMLYLIRKMGEGKSLVLLGMATMLRGVTVCLVPLLGLGSSQAAKSRSRNHRVEGYHVDEFRDQDFDLLSERMSIYSSTESSSIIVYISPQNLRAGSKWYRLLSNIAAAGFLSSVCIDEAHAAVEQCESFCPEFKDAIKSVKQLLAISKVHHPDIDIPLLIMSATFRIPEQRTFNNLIGDTPEMVMWGEMDRCSVGIFAQVDGEPLSHLINTWAEDTIKMPEMKSLIMTNSAAAAEGRIIDRLEKASDNLPSLVYSILENASWLLRVTVGL